ncbi:MAG: homoserine dehydrogenase [Nitrospirae bacterium]|nr:homoserine dehydrogenase [Nitrospirota bacterium]
MKDRINVGIIGFGTVGSGAARILINNADIIKRRLGIPVVLKKMADLDIKKDRGIKLDKDVLTTDAAKILDDPDIDIVIELIGGYEPAKSFILKAIERGKCVVTSNKALLAVHGEEIFHIAASKGVDIGFEGSVGGGIPIIRILKEGLAANNILSIYGIINGTSNYILTKMTNEGRAFGDVLSEAQRLGYAEADLTFDIEGIDSAHKLTILTTLAFGTPVKFDNIYTEGITRITPLDIEYAKEFGYKIKLLAISKMDNGQIEARVHPTMVPNEYLISTVEGVFNAIYVAGDAVGDTMYYGRGAGDMPTGSAITSDIIEIARNIITNSVGRVPPPAFQLKERKELKIKKMDDIVCPFYLRFMAMDRPSVLSKISGILGEHNISIASMIQKGRKEDGAVSVVMMTHEAKEKDVQGALAKIDKLPVIADKTMFIRVEGEV